MISKCAICGGFGTTHEYDVFDESGGRICRICDDCKDKVSQSRCAVCGDRVPEDNDSSIGPHGTPQEVHRHLCPSCRRGIRSGEGGDIR